MSHSHKNPVLAFPVEELNIEELKFWLRIFQEHALFIKNGLPCDETAAIDESQTFYEEFGDLRVRADRVSSSKKFLELVGDTQSILQDFYNFKRRLLHRALSCQLGGSNFPLFLDHLSREAEYALRLLARIQAGTLTYTDLGIAGETAFWLRIMADHAKFIRQSLDPSERNLIATTDGFSWEFDDLFLQGRDFVSMLAPDQLVPAFTRFLQDVRAAMLRLRDFKKAASQMIEECRLLGIIPALMADHVLREADHFLVLLTMMEKGLVKQCAEGRVDILSPQNPIPPLQKQVMYAAGKSSGNFSSDEDEEDCDEDDEDEDEDEPREQEREEEVQVANKTVATKEIDEDDEDEEDDSDSSPVGAAASGSKNAKYQWSNKWPSPLGKHS